MYTKVIAGTVLSAMIFSLVVFVASAAETQERAVKVLPVPSTTQIQKRTTTATDEARIQKEERLVNNTDTWNMYVKQKNLEMQAKRKELTAQKKELEEKVKALRLERANARKELITSCRQQKFVAPSGVEATPTAEERKEFLASERIRIKECWEAVKVFDLETRANILELRKSNLTTEKTVLGLSTETPYDEIVAPAFPW